MLVFAKYLPAALVTVASGFNLLPFLNTPVAAQEFLVREQDVDQQNIQRVIELRNSSVAPPVPTDHASRSVQQEVRPILQSRSTGSSPSPEGPQSLSLPTVSSRAQLVAPKPVVPSSNTTSKAPTNKVSPPAVIGQMNLSQTPVSISNVGPSIKTDIEAPGYINLNETATLRIKLQNVGRSNAGVVKLIATLPAHAKFSRANPTPTASNGQVHEFVIKDIGSEQIREITLDLIPTAKLPLDIGTEVRVENMQRIAVGVRQPTLMVNIEGPLQATIGEKVTHSVLVTNTGDGVAENVTLSAIFPNGLEPVKSKRETSLFDIEPGKSVTAEFEMLATKAGLAPLNFSANARSVETQSASLDVKVYQPELNVAFVGPGMNFVEREGIYSIKLENTGEVAASNVKVQLNVPAGLTVTTISRQAKVDQESGLLVWNYNLIPAKSSESIMLKMVGASAGSQICNIDVRSDQNAPKQMQLATQIATRADLQVAIFNQSGPVPVGGTAKFLVIVENSGSSSASGVNINVELPESLTPEKIEGGGATEFGNTIAFKNAKLDAGQSREFVFTATVSEQGEHIVRSTLQAAGSERKMITEGSVFAYEINEARVSEALSPAINR